MGKIFQGIFGGSKSKQKSQQTSEQQSSSMNQAYPLLQQTYAPNMQTGLNATNALSSLLGLGGDPAAFEQGFNDYKNSSGYDFIFDQGQKAVTGNNAVKGLLNSGSTLKGLNKFGTNTASSYFNQYLDRLFGLSDQGLKTGNLLASAGSTSQSTGQSQGTSSGSSSTKPGIGKFLGQAMSDIATSDPRLKMNIIPLGTRGDLTLYRFDYISGQGPYIGFMADEVKEKYPDAMGPTFGEEEYMTIDYGKLEAILNG